jgi:hypothetical protein
MGTWVVAVGTVVVATEVVLVVVVVVASASVPQAARRSAPTIASVMMGSVHGERW